MKMLMDKYMQLYGTLISMGSIIRVCENKRKWLWMHGSKCNQWQRNGHSP